MPIRRLPPAPDLGHLRNEAKLLQRRVRSGDPGAIAMVRELHPRLALIDADATELAQFTRADAQLVVARQYGFASWTRLRRHVDAVVRPIDSLAELARVFDVVGAQSVPPISHTDRRYADQERRFPDDRPMMLLAADRGQIVGGGFAFRRDSSPSCSVATLRNLAVRPAYQGLGLERRLVEGIERGAISLGVTDINLGGPRGAERAFYLSMGYHGRHEGGLMGKRLAGGAPLRDPDRRRRLEELRARRARRQAARTPGASGGHS